MEPRRLPPSVAAVKPPSFDTLPNNLVVFILLHATDHDVFVLWLATCAQVCPQWRQIVQHECVGYGRMITTMPEAPPVTRRQQRQTSLQVDGSGRWKMQRLSTEGQTRFEHQLRWMPDTPVWAKDARAWTLYIVSSGLSAIHDADDGCGSYGFLEFDDPMDWFENQIDIASEDPDSDVARRWSPEQRRAGALIQRPRFNNDSLQIMCGGQPCSRGSLLGEQGFCLFAEALQHLHAPMRLSAICLNHVGATASTLPPFAAALLRGFAGEGLRILDLSFNPGIGDAGLVVLAPVLPPTLSHLILSDVGCGQHDVNGGTVPF